MIKAAKNKAVVVEKNEEDREMSTYTCQVCGRSIKANGNIRISCINCNQPMKEVV